MDESSIDLNADVGEGFGRCSLGDDALRERGRTLRSFVDAG
jgi:hypothetical protein